LIGSDDIKTTVAGTIDRTIRTEWGRILAALTKSLGDLQLAEDCLQDAVESALNHWQKNGLPDSPVAWLIQTARRKAIDRFRRDSNFNAKQAEIAHLIELDAMDNSRDGSERENETIPDERLRMMFTCCHPAIEEKSRIALTLRTLGGLTTEEIASAYLDKTDAMAARLTRAKKKIALAGIPYEIPDKSRIAERLHSVLSVIYLIYNEGYSASNGDVLIRRELTDEALRLARMVCDLLPDEPEVKGLVALILLHESRRKVRTDAEGNLVPLEMQNRKNWDSARISEGTGLLKSALAMGRIGPYQLQAAISACHAEAISWADTDWPQIASLYELLLAIQPSPVIALNHAYALSHTRGVGEALERLSRLQTDLAGYQPFHAAKADMLERSGRKDEAKAAYGRAIELSQNTAEREFLETKLARID